MDLVIANLPYIPLEAFESVVPEVRDHDPLIALFAGQDGLDAIKVVVAEAARLLRPAGLLCIEHAELQGESAPQILVQHGGFVGTRSSRFEWAAAICHSSPEVSLVILSLPRL